MIKEVKSPDDVLEEDILKLIAHAVGLESDKEEKVNGVFLVITHADESLSVYRHWGTSMARVVGAAHIGLHSLCEDIVEENIDGE